MENKYKNNETIKYYDTNADSFVDATINADVSELYKKFESLIPPGGRILDIGCGSGRDSRYFTQKGFHVTAIDPSSVMCKKTRDIVNIPVITMKAEDIQYEKEFDAVWACASLLHVSRENMPKTIKAIIRSLKPGGVFYGSWKYGEKDRFSGGRTFTDYTKESLSNVLREISSIEAAEMWITNDVRRERSSEQWLNVLMIAASLHSIST